MGESGLGKKLALSVVAGGLTAIVVWGVYTDGRPTDTVLLVDTRQQLEAIFDEGPSYQEVPSWAPLLRVPLDESEASTFFPIVGANVYDPNMLSRRQSNMSVNRPFPEYPGGRWVVRTNKYGMREDTNPAEEQPDYRVIIVGDSHVDGVCPNHDSFPNQVESMLKDQSPHRSIEVLNVSNGGWSFYNYLGALESYLWLKPNVFVVTVYGGNDFGSLPLHHYHRGEPLSLSDPEMQRTLAVLSRTQSGRAQFFNQAVYFESNPEEEAAAAEMAQEVMREIIRVARENDIRVVGVYLPPLRDVQRPRYREILLAHEEALRLSPEALSAADRLADEWLTWLVSEGVASLDLRPAFRDSPQPLYWSTDQHINVAGHELAARQLLPILKSLIPPEARPLEAPRGR